MIVLYDRALLSLQTVPLDRDWNAANHVLPFRSSTMLRPFE